MLLPLTHRFLNLSIEKKICASIALIIICTYSLFNGISYSNIRNEYERLIDSTMESAAASVTYQLKSEITNLVTLSDILRSDNTIQNQLSLVYDGYDYVSRGSIESIYQSQQSYFQNYKKNFLIYTAIITANFSTYTYGFRYDRLSGESIEYLSMAAASGSGAPVWYADPDSPGRLYLVRQIRKIKNLELSNLGILVLAIDMDRLLAEISDGTANDYPVSWIFSEEGRTIYASDALGELPKDLKLSGYAGQPLSLNGMRYYVRSGYLSDLKWEYDQLVPYERIDNAQTRLHYSRLFIGLLCVFLTIVLVFHMVRRLTFGLKLLVKKLHDFNGENSEPVTQYYDASGREDEIGLLHQQFDKMAQEIELHITNEYKLQLEMKNIQLKSLQAQINPHFLYNTLNSISWKAKAAKNPDISRMAESLGSLLRFSISNKKHLVPLRQELQFVDDYLTIQKIRYRDKLKVEICIPESFHTGLLPPLSLQPLVENSIRYGLEESLDSITIILTADQAENGDLLLSVMNTGSEFEDSLLEKLTEKEGPNHGFGLGLLNIQKRIRLIFGGNYGLTFENKNGFATASVRIPYTTFSNESFEQDSMG